MSAGEEMGEDSKMGGGGANGGDEVIGSAALRPIFLGNLMPNYTRTCGRAFMKLSRVSPILLLLLTLFKLFILLFFSF